METNKDTRITMNELDFFKLLKYKEIAIQQNKGLNDIIIFDFQNMKSYKDTLNSLDTIRKKNDIINEMYKNINILQNKIIKLKLNKCNIKTLIKKMFAQ